MSSNIHAWYCCLITLLVLWFGKTCRGDTTGNPAVPSAVQSPEVPKTKGKNGKPVFSTPENSVDFNDPEAIIDLSDALRSKQFVHRAILSSVIHDTSRFDVNSLYINHLMGFSSVYNRTGHYAKFTTGLQGISIGYVTKGGHAIEAGAEFSAVGNAYLGYRYFIRFPKFSLWPFVGAGLGTAVKSFNFASPPPGQDIYTGTSQMEFVTLGVLIPLIDVGLKAEFRFLFFGGDRIVLTQGIGAILFL